MKHLIIDSDPGVDDALALLYAFSLPQFFRVLLVSLTFGNVSLKQCFRNAYTIFAVAHQQGLLGPGTPGADMGKIPLALGQSSPLLTSDMVNAAHAHGGDGLGGIYTNNSHYIPTNWENIFEDVTTNAANVEGEATLPFTIAPRLAHLEILRTLESHEPQTVTILAIGPLTNIARAAISDPVTFSRVKEIVIMGGAIDETGNTNPFAEFNTFADPDAAAITFALTNPASNTALPSNLAGLHSSALRQLRNPVKVTLLPLDITRRHYMREDEWDDAFQGSELADFVRNVTASSFRPLPRSPTGEPGLSKALVAHDPLCLWYVQNADRTDPNHSLFKRDVMGVRVETAGDWTKGMCCVDRRPNEPTPAPTDEDSSSIDPGSWMDSSLGNSVGVLKDTPGRKEWIKTFAQAVFGNQ